MLILRLSLRHDFEPQSSEIKEITQPDVPIPAINRNLRVKVIIPEGEIFATLSQQLGWSHKTHKNYLNLDENALRFS